MPVEKSRNPAQANIVTYAQLALGMAMFGSATPVSKIVAASVPVFVGSALRVAIGALVLLPIVYRRRHKIVTLGRREWIVTGLIALLGMFGFSVLMLYGMSMLHGVTGAIVMSTAPAVTAAASMTFMRDRPTWRKLAAIGLAVAGVLILQIGDGAGEDNQPENLLLGSALVFGAVCCEACYTLLGKTIAEKTDPVLVAFLAAALSVPLFVPFAIRQWHEFDWSSIDPNIWMAIVWYGAGTLALGSWFWYGGVAKARGSIAAGFMGIMPVSALLLSYFLLDEQFQWRHLAGFAVVFAGVILVSREHGRMATDGDSG